MLNKYKLILFVVIIICVGCKKKFSSKNSVEPSSKDEKVTVIESSNLLEKCDATKNFNIVYIKDVQKLMICLDLKWQEINTTSSQTIQQNITNQIAINSLSELWRDIWIKNVQKVTYIWVKYKTEENCNVFYSGGSGFVVETNIVVTNGHIIRADNCSIEWIKVYFLSNVSMSGQLNHFELATHIDKSIMTTDDMVLIQTNTGNITPVLLSELDEASDNVQSKGTKIGDDVMLLSYVGGTNFVHLTTGKINAIQKISTKFLYDLVLSGLLVEGKYVYEYDLISGSGASGAPVFNTDGKVIGIHFAGNNSAADTEFGYALQIKPLRELLAKPRQWVLLK